MNNRAFLLIFLLILFASGSGITSMIKKVEASGTTYIRADGSIDPPTANITSLDNITYTLTGNVTDDFRGIIIERNNIVVDGANYFLQGIGADYSRGIDITGRTNVTIRNIQIQGFWYGISLNMSSDICFCGNTVTNSDLYAIHLEGSSNNTFSGNNITNNNGISIWLWKSSNHNTISSNNIRETTTGIRIAGPSSCNDLSANYIDNINVCIALAASSNNTISNNNMNNSLTHAIVFDSFSTFNSVFENNITNSGCGIRLSGWSNNNTIHENKIANNDCGIELTFSSDNVFHDNDFINNTEQVSFRWSSLTNHWDDGVSRGNYWSDYLERYPNATELDGSGIWDTPYIIGENNQDNYPLIPEFTAHLIFPLFMAITVIAAFAYRRKKNLMRTD